MLDRLELATERRDPVIADQARQLRNRYFDQPLILQRQAEAYEELERHLSALMEDPDRADRAEQIDAVVTAPQLLAPQIIGRMTETGAREHPVLLEIMTRRWYRERELTDFWSGVTSDGTAYVTTQLRGRTAGAITSPRRSSTRSDLDDVAGAISRRAAQYPQGESVYVDLYAAATAGEELAERPQGGARARGRPAARPAHRARRARRRSAASPAPTRSRCAARSTAAGSSTATCSSCTRSWPSG